MYTQQLEHFKNDIVKIPRASGKNRCFWFNRVREAIQIKRRGSNLNKDKGRHQQPSAYDSILSSDRRLSTSGQMTKFPATLDNISRH